MATIYTTRFLLSPPRFLTQTLSLPPLSPPSPAPRWSAPEVLDDYRSAAAGGKRVQATKRTRFASFPPYLTVVIKRWGPC